MARNDLGHLGVTVEQEAVYRTLLRRPDSRVSDLVRDTGLEAHAVEAALAALEGLDLIRRSAGRTVELGDPAVTVGRLLDQQVTQLQQRLRRVVASHHVISGLTLGRAGSAVAGRMELVDGPANVARTIDELAGRSFEEVLTVIPRTLPGELIQAARKSLQPVLQRGTAVRGIVTPGYLDAADKVRLRPQLRTIGAQIKVSRPGLDPMMVFDRRVALLPAEPADPFSAVWSVRQPGLIAPLVALFERCWSSAEELDHKPPTEQERRVLDAMVRVEKDETGARELNMSLRTYRSYVAALMRRVGAGSRVQCALAARERGWI
ncbi:hypothetical protein [Kitasatospora sp. LaBMicrA B282]|uniref:hypothetical protein n=1 Tax=Kitasatospora sp. LaBMicrA B282 TaxID=3420949 RepID=UPI003D106869